MRAGGGALTTRISEYLPSWVLSSHLKAAGCCRCQEGREIMRSENVRKNLAPLLFLITIILLSLAMYGFYRVALDTISSGAVRLGLESPEYKRLEAPVLRPFE